MKASPFTDTDRSARQCIYLYTPADFTVQESPSVCVIQSPRETHSNNNPTNFLNTPTRRPDRVLGTLGVLTITFFYACGGPSGSEPLVAIAGPLGAVLGLTLYALFISVPYAAIISELSTAFPEDGGFTIWVLNAFGPFWSIQVGYWSWVAGTVSVAAFSSSVMGIVSRQLGEPLENSYIVDAAISLLMTIPLLFGTKFVNRLTLVLLAVVLVPVAVFTAFGLASGTSAGAADLGVIRRANTTTDESTGLVNSVGAVDIDWFQLISALYWNFDGIRMGSVFGGQVKNPAAVYSRVIWLVLVLTVVVNLVPLVAAVVSGTLDWTMFEYGVYTDIASDKLGGSVLHAMMVTFMFATCLGLHVGTVFCCSTEISGMAENELVLRQIAMRNDKFGSPHYAIGATLVVSLSLMAFPMEKLVPVSNTFGGLVAIAIFASAIQLRRSMGFMSRPSRVPGGVWVLVAISILPISVSMYVIVKSLSSSLSSTLIVLGFLTPAVIYGTFRSRHFFHRMH